MKLLLIEDEKGLAESIATHLTKDGHVCEAVYMYEEAIEKIHLYTYDCIIVDLNLPGGDGFQVIEALKKVSASTGIIIISARHSVDDKIKGLETGSDDYLTKPFHLSELNARIKSLMRRRNFGGNNDIVFNELCINLNTRQLFIHGKEVYLTRKEYDLLMYFMANKNTALTKVAIAEHLWGDHMDNADSLDVIYSQIKNLRKKLLDNGAAEYLHSIYGIGYKFGES